VTQAIAFGKDKEPPAPAPFEITDGISGTNWAVLRYPEQTASVAVRRRGEKQVERMKLSGKGVVLFKGLIFSKGEKGGLSLELSGLEPGKTYDLALFGMGFMGARLEGSQEVNLSASDNPDATETIDMSETGGGAHFFVYEYVAPSDGTLTVDLKNSETNMSGGSIRLCAFLNYRVK